MSQAPLRTLPTDNNRKYNCAPITATPGKPQPARKFREGKIRRAKHHLTTSELPTPPRRCSSGLCATLPFFKPTFEEVVGISEYETEVRRTISLEEYRNWKSFQFKPEREAGGFETYITSKQDAPQEWINRQQEKRHNITCEHYGPPRTPHPTTSTGTLMGGLVRRE